MKPKKSCCDFFRKHFCKKAESTPSHATPSKPCKSSKEKSELPASNKTVSTESKSRAQKVHESSISEIDCEGNSIFYDKNSALIDSIDQNKAMDNLEIAFGIICNSDCNISERSAGKSPEKFARVIKGINFKEILEGNESIVMSDRSST